MKGGKKYSLNLAGFSMTTNRITVDIDKSLIRFILSYLRFIFLFKKKPKFRKTSRGYHLWLYFDRKMSDKDMFKYRKLLFDDENRIRLDMVCITKPRQILFDEKIVVLIENGKKEKIRHAVLK